MFRHVNDVIIFCNSVGDCVCTEGGVGKLLEVSIEHQDIGGGDHVTAAVNQLSEDGVWEVEYEPIIAGPHTVNVLWAGQHISASPFTTHVAPR